TYDLSGLVPAGLRPVSLAFLLCGAIIVALGVAGVLTDDPYDGLARALADACACMAGFAVLGRYLGLRAGPTTS
ncbi:MAG: hypothetical protein ACRDKL_06535, partial [Solirubrobacteraceae bacterium]